MATEIGVATLELTLIGLLTGLASIILFLSYHYRDKILSPEGKAIFLKNIKILRISVLLGMMSLFIFLVSESLALLEVVLNEGRYGEVHELMEIIHLFVIVVPMVVFIQILFKFQKVET